MQHAKEAKREILELFITKSDETLTWTEQDIYEQSWKGDKHYIDQINHFYVGIDWIWQDCSLAGHDVIQQNFIITVD